MAVAKKRVEKCQNYDFLRRLLILIFFSYYFKEGGWMIKMNERSFFCVRLNEQIFEMF